LNNAGLKAVVRLKEGEKVRHKDGGPTMTVMAVEDDLVTCAWTDEDGDETGEFHVSLLVRIPPGRPNFKRVIRT
jgi:uncharacterized protein YodC (DUF2158 family)